MSSSEAGADSPVGAWLLDGRGGARKLGWAGIAEWRPAQGLLWVHLDRADTRSRGWLEQESGTEEIVAEALLAEETRPRCSEIGDGLLLFLRGVNLNPGSDPEDMVSVRVWVESHRIISVRLRRLLSVDDLRAALEAGRGPTDAGEFVELLTDRLVERMSEVVDRLDDTVDALQEKILTDGADGRIRGELLRARYQIIALRRFLSPQREAMSRLAQLRPSWLDQHDVLGVREQAERTARYVEDLDSARDRASVVQEELSSRLSEQINSRMYVLSLVAGIFLPLSFVTGLLGINVGGIPLANNSLGFMLILGVLMILLVGELLLFRSRRWF